MILNLHILNNIYTEKYVGPRVVSLPVSVPSVPATLHPFITLTAPVLPSTGGLRIVRIRIVGFQFCAHLKPDILSKFPHILRGFFQ